MSKVSEKATFSDSTPIPLNSNVSIIPREFTVFNINNFGTYSTDDTKFLNGVLVDKVVTPGGYGGIVVSTIKLDDSDETITTTSASPTYYFKEISKPASASGGIVRDDLAEARREWQLGKRDREEEASSLGGGGGVGVGYSSAHAAHAGGGTRWLPPNPVEPVSNPPPPPSSRYVLLATIRDSVGMYSPFHGSNTYEDVAWIYHDNHDLENPDSWFESTTRIDGVAKAKNWTFYSRGDREHIARFPASQASQRMPGGKRKTRRQKRSRKSRRQKKCRKSRRIVNTNYY
jgi:hypothetical protein